MGIERVRSSRASSAHTASPSMPGMLTSRRMTSIGWLRTISRHCRPLRAGTVEKFCIRSSRVRISTASGSSSTTSTAPSSPARPSAWPGLAGLLRPASSAARPEFWSDGSLMTPCLPPWRWAAAGAAWRPASCASARAAARRPACCPRFRRSASSISRFSNSSTAVLRSRSRP